MKQYKVVLSNSGKRDVKERKQYILKEFKYRELAENFTKKIKRAKKSCNCPKSVARWTKLEVHNQEMDS